MPDQVRHDREGNGLELTEFDMISSLGPCFFSKNLNFLIALH